MSLFDTKVESLTGENGKWMPSKGQHNAKVVALINIGMINRKNDEGEEYQVQGIQLVWAIEEKNSRGEHMIIRQDVYMSLKSGTTLGDLVKDAGWKITNIRDILGKTAKIFVKIQKSKSTGKDYAKVGVDVMEGGFNSTGTIILPFWYNDMKKEDVIMIDGVTIGSKQEKKVAKLEESNDPEFVTKDTKLSDDLPFN